MTFEHRASRGVGTETAAEPKQAPPPIPDAIAGAFENDSIRQPRDAVDEAAFGKRGERRRKHRLLVAAFGIQSLVYYGLVSWLPNVYVERGWDEAAAGALVADMNAVGLTTTIGVPLVADRLGGLLREVDICFAAESDLASADVIVVAVGTPMRDDGCPDLEQVETAAAH